MSSYDILVSCGYSPEEASRISRKPIADANEKKYNPGRKKDSMKDVYDDAGRIKDSIGNANFGIVYGSNWESGTVIGGQ